MRGNFRVAVVGVAVAIGLAATSGATAQTSSYPPCDPATKPAASFDGLPAQLINGREEVFGITDNYSDFGPNSIVESDFEVTMSEAGVPFLTGTVGEYESADSLGIRSDRGDGPLTVSASYAESRLSEFCTRVISLTVSGVDGRPLPALRVGIGYEEGRFRLSEPRRCKSRYAPDPIAVSVKPKRGGRWVTVGLADQCAGWKRVRKTGRRFELKRQSFDRSTLLFIPRTPRRNGVEDFRYRISRATIGGRDVTLRRTLRRGVLRVHTTHRPAERVYAWNGSQVNDEYWNYCVNEGKQTWMHNGNAYCVYPSATWRKVRVHR